MLVRVKMILSAGPWVGIFAMLMLAVYYITVKILSIMSPADQIEKAVDFPYEAYKNNRHLLDHSLRLPRNGKDKEKDKAGDKKKEC